MTKQFNISETSMKIQKVSKLISRAECDVAALVGVGRQPNVAKLFGVPQEAIDGATARLEACYRSLEAIHAELNQMAVESSNGDVQAFIGDK